MGTHASLQYPRRLTHPSGKPSRKGMCAHDRAAKTRRTPQTILPFAAGTQTSADCGARAHSAPDADNRIRNNTQEACPSPDARSMNAGSTSTNRRAHDPIPNPTHDYLPRSFLGDSPPPPLATRNVEHWPGPKDRRRAMLIASCA